MALPCSNAFLFSVQQALPGELSPALAAVAVDADEKTLFVRCLFDGAVGEAEHEFMEYMQAAVWADFFPTLRVEVEAIAASQGGGSPLGALAYRRDARELVRA